MENIKRAPGASKARFLINILATLLLAGLNYGVWLDAWTRQETLSPGSSRLAGSLLAMCLLTLVMDVIVLVQIWRSQALSPLLKLRRRFGGLGWAAAVLTGLVPAWFYYFTPWSANFYGTSIRLVICLFTLGVMAWMTAGREDQAAYTWQGWMAAVILLGTLFSLGAAFREVSSYPFGLYWSEGNRFYDYSLMFGQDLYDFPSGSQPAAYLSLGRQGLWGLYFLLPKISILGMRLWNGIVFTIPYFILGWLCIKWRRSHWKSGLLFGFWAFLFLNQGPIYTPLILAGILVALAQKLPLRAGWMVMLAAGFYASVSRETWMFAPAMWIVGISLVEADPVEHCSIRDSLAALIRLQGKTTRSPTPTDSLDHPSQRRTWVEGWRRAVILGFSGLMGGYILPAMIPQLRQFLPGGGDALSAEGVGQLIERQPLLWERLFPNPTYPPGIIGGLLLAVAPLIILVLVFGSRGRWRLDAWQKLSIILTAFAFLGVGIVVSVKIGGGSNLHNLDMLLISLLFTAGLAWNEGGGTWVISGKARNLAVKLLISAVLLIPSIPGVIQATYQASPPTGIISRVLENINGVVQAAKSQGEILFMDQRQLITFGYVKNVPMVAEYEKKQMMDEALASKASYFAPFYRDLANHRFSLIISEPLWVNFQEGQKGFSNENNAWVTWVSVPVLCYYTPLETQMDVGVQLLVPKEKSAPVPGVSCPQD